jgi:hypothetical protein
MSFPLNVIIVEKAGTLKSLAVKDFKLEELYKKCGFKKGDDFLKQTEWTFKTEGKKYYIELYGKTDGRPGAENKYDFPPPVDSALLFGSCALVAYSKGEKKIFADLTLPMWNKAYEKLFGGFEDLTANANDDDNEEDELAAVSKSKKTKQGYLKDGFVVDGSNDSCSGSEEDTEGVDGEEEDTEYETESDSESDNSKLYVEDVGSELSEEEYEYDNKPMTK